MKDKVFMFENGRFVPIFFWFAEGDKNQEAILMFQRTGLQPSIREVQALAERQMINEANLIVSDLETLKKLVNEMESVKIVEKI